MLAVRRARSRLQALPRQVFASTDFPAGLSTALPGKDERKQHRGDFVQVPASLEHARDRALKAYTRISTLYERASSTKYGRLMRLDKPTGTQLLFLPCAWGVALGATSVADVVGLSALLYGGAILARGGGCTVNDIWDADVDRRVKRTARRPIASGEVGTTSAVAFAATQFVGGLGVLTMLSPTAFMLGTATLVPALYYPIAKRVVPYPQAVLAFTFNTGALIGYTATTNALAIPAIALYASGICWTMIYDTIYAHQDKRDDGALGVRSTAIEFGDDPRRVLTAFGVAQFASLLVAGLLTDLSTPFYMGASVAAVRVYQQISATDLDDPKACAKSFNDSAATGALIWASILAGRVL